ncbi:unnamed protein product [Caenorhabditis auriculariae]|uniref:Uncharacterized protein n=1 Tax=Caenorhabditis auriculariae TaxID=2777116 RepID=A0A8S1GNK4_9PELO|nr:unnamed protein product [Caenorhabditis auriculariae]
MRKRLLKAAVEWKGSGNGLDVRHKWAEIWPWNIVRRHCHMLSFHSAASPQAVPSYNATRLATYLISRHSK